MTTRQKFWLKVVLAVTFPLWVVPTVIAGSMYLFGCLIWMAVDDIVESKSRARYPSVKRFP